MFDIYFDIERLTWALITEKLEYKLKVHFETMMNSLLMPTLELSQAYFIADQLTTFMQKDYELNKHFRLVGPSSSSKTVVLNTFMHKVATPVKTITVPMAAFLTLKRLRTKIEEVYQYKRKNTMEPRDSEK